MALVFGVTKFLKYIYGRQFTLLTDHKPLMTILHPAKSIPPLAASRIQRWATFSSLIIIRFSSGIPSSTAMRMVYPDFPLLQSLEEGRPWRLQKRHAFTLVRSMPSQ